MVRNGQLELAAFDFPDNMCEISHWAQVYTLPFGSWSQEAFNIYKNPFL